MADRVKDVCDGIVTLLNAGPLSGVATAVRANVWVSSLESGTDIKVAVMPTELETLTSTRASTERRLTVQVILVKRLQQQNLALRLAEEDDLMNLAEDIEDALMNVPQGVMRFVEFNSRSASRELIENEETGGRGIFRTVVELTYAGE